MVAAAAPAELSAHQKRFPATQAASLTLRPSNYQALGSDLTKMRGSISFEPCMHFKSHGSQDTVSKQHPSRIALITTTYTEPCTGRVVYLLLRSGGHGWSCRCCWGRRCRRESSWRCRCWGSWRGRSRRHLSRLRSRRSFLRCLWSFCFGKQVLSLLLLLLQQDI